MTHPKGSIVYAPHENFSFPRAYVSEIFLHIESHLTYVVAGDEIVFQYSPIPLYRAYLKFRDEFWYAATNSFTLDWIVEWNYQTNFSGDTETTFFLGVAFNYDIAQKRRSIDITTVSPSLDSRILLPAYPRPYWLPISG
jgi:hypothetical protein